MEIYLKRPLSNHALNLPCWMFILAILLNFGLSSDVCLSMIFSYFVEPSALKAKSWWQTENSACMRFKCEEWNQFCVVMCHKSQNTINSSVHSTLADAFLNEHNKSHDISHQKSHSMPSKNIIAYIACAQSLQNTDSALHENSI